jgi:hypothetical protein
MCLIFSSKKEKWSSKRININIFSYYSSSLSVTIKQTKIQGLIELSTVQSDAMNHISEGAENFILIQQCLTQTGTQQINWVLS